MFNLKQFFMQKKNLFGIALLCASVFLFTGCKEIMSHFDNAVDSHLQVADKLTIIGVDKTYQIAKDVDYKTISDAAPEFTVDKASKGIVEVDKTTGVVKGLKSGDATIKISLPDNGLYLDATASITIKVRVHNTDEFYKNVEALADGDQILFAENANITLNKDVDLTGKKITIKGDQTKPANITATKSIKGISDNFTIENVKFDASNITGSLFILDGSTVAAKKQDGTDSDAYKYIESIKLSNLEVTGLVKAFLRDAQKIYVANLEVDNCVIGFNSQQNVFDFNGKGYPANLKVTNSTIWAPSNTKTNYLLQSGGRVKDLDPNQLEYKQNVTVDSCTFYRVAQGMQINNMNGKGQTSLILTLKNSILVDSGSKSGDEVRGWLGGQNSNNPSVTYEKNTYWAGDAVAAGWTNSSKQGYDASGTSLTTDPNFKDPANGDFTPQGAKQVENKTGDPRWFK